jgi:hypothetical protein
VQGVNCLQDLKKKLAEAGFEVFESCGWYLNTAHGRWTMANGVVYIDNNPIKSISEAKIIKKSISKKKKKK